MPTIVRCGVCSSNCRINSRIYAPPMQTRQAILAEELSDYSVIDEAFWHGKLGWVCVGCFGEVDWSAEDLQTLQHDWGYKGDSV